MGTNFYFVSKKKEAIEDIKKHLEKIPYLNYGERNLDVVANLIEDGYSIHLGKTSGGWNPTLDIYLNPYYNVKTLVDFLEKNANEGDIEDEYGDKYTLEEFRERFLKFGRDMVNDDRLREDELKTYGSMPVDHYANHVVRISNDGYFR